MKKERSSGSIRKRPLSILIVLMIMCMISGGIIYASSGLNTGETAKAAGTTLVTDASSMDGWKDIAENNTKYIGRVWTDKSVFSENITLSPSGITVEKGDSDFMVALSAISSTSNITTTMDGMPLDIVMVLDTSGILPLIGVGDVYYKGKRCEAISVLDEFGWEPVKLKSKEGLALLNGTQFMSANGVYAILKAFRLSKKADLIAAISLEAFDGRIDPFMDCIQQMRPHKGQIETGAAFRRILEGSEIIAQPKQHVQDPYSFRCIPQVHGATKDAINHVASVLLTEINSVTDNPTIFPDEDLIISGGNFHGQPLALVYDYLAIAMAELGNISERRVAQLIMGLRGLPEFLVANPGLNSGFMIPQYAAASMVSQNKMYCYAASSDSIVSSNGQEEL